AAGEEGATPASPDGQTARKETLMGSVAKSVAKGVGKVVSSVLGLDPGQAPSQDVLNNPPKVEAPTPMPTPNDEAVRAARRRAEAAQRQRRGRASTIYTAADDGLGG
ncbi:MAG TPA: hypothetical protein VFO41_12710, partial [Alphaproteobacteria bacterium]|nr:hypothetical protein [Alphaproteobacteria bacterium]